MELKLQKYKEIQLANDVLIVPLWNWNNKPPAIEPIAESSNCTFMELKLRR